MNNPSVCGRLVVRYVVIGDCILLKGSREGEPLQFPNCVFCMQVEPQRDRMGIPW